MNEKNVKEIVKQVFEKMNIKPLPIENPEDAGIYLNGEKITYQYLKEMLLGDTNNNLVEEGVSI